jgi:PilZ domain
MSENVPIPVMSSLQTLQQRKTERVYCNRPVHLRTSDAREFTALCTDVNGSGIGVESERVLAVGQRIELMLSGEERVPMMVMYRMSQHYGLSALGSFEAVLDVLPKQ